MDTTRNRPGSPPPFCAGRSPRLRYRVGLDRAGMSCWAQPERQAALRRLLDAGQPGEGSGATLSR